MIKNITKLKNWIGPKTQLKINLIIAAGFEDRSLGATSILSNYKRLEFNKAIVIDYQEYEQNESNRTKLLKLTESIFNNVVIIDTENISSVSSEIENSSENSLLLFDISGMSRLLMFKLLYIVDNLNINYNLVYTEAENYYPDVEFYNTLKSEKSDTILKAYDEIEDEEVVYSKECTVSQPSDFMGNHEPGNPSIFIGFLTFKRSRLQCILSMYEFTERHLILSIPDREDLKWRANLQKIINTDMINSRPSNLIELSTLYPYYVYKTLKNIVLNNDSFLKANIYFAPLGSKLQTVGSFFFWNEFKDISVLFSHPNQYFPDKFSNGVKDTFILID